MKENPTLIAFANGQARILVVMRRAAADVSRTIATRLVPGNGFEPRENVGELHG